LLFEADLDRKALVDERGCRRDIRSNGWIDFRESSLSQNRSGRRNGFSSFGAESLLRNFTGPKARMKSGPDVFADALVPRNLSRSPERSAFPGTSFVPTAAPLTPGAFDPSKSLHPVSIAPGPCRDICMRIVHAPRKRNSKTPRFHEIRPELFTKPDSFAFVDC